MFCTIYAAAPAKSLQSCPTLCDPIDGSPPGSSIPGIFQARTLEWVAISFSNAWMWKVKVKSLSRIWLLATPWTAAYQAPPSMGFSRQQYWSGVPLPSPSPPSSYWIFLCKRSMCVWRHLSSLSGYKLLCIFRPSDLQGRLCLFICLLDLSISEETPRPFLSYTSCFSLRRTFSPLAFAVFGIHCSPGNVP